MKQLFIKLIKKSINQSITYLVVQVLFFESEIEQFKAHYISIAMRCAKVRAQKQS